MLHILSAFRNLFRVDYEVYGVSRACGIRSGEEKCMQGFGVET